MKLSHAGVDHHSGDAGALWPAQLTFELDLTLKMSSPCTDCGCTDATVVTAIGHYPVRCVVCGSLRYNEPKATEIRRHGSRRNRPWIGDRDRDRILVRDMCSCVKCHRGDVELDVAHMLSVYDGNRLGLPDALLYSDENLAAMCKRCNGGMGRQSMPLWLAVGILRARCSSADFAAA